MNPAQCPGERLTKHNCFIRFVLFVLCLIWKRTETRKEAKNKRMK